jgi:hypothetical protein
MMSDKLEKLKKIIEENVGEDSFRIDEVTNQVFIIQNDRLSAILKLMDGDYIKLNLRASLAPNNAAYLACIIYLSYNIKIDENFEIDANGKWYFGDDALKYAAKNVLEKWSDNSDPSKLN